MAFDNTVSISCGCQTLSGFVSFSLITGLDEVPSRFEVSVAQNPDAPGYVEIQSGQLCTIKIGNDVVLTGYVGGYAISISGQSHVTTFRGDSKFADLMRCSAVVKSAIPGADDTTVFGNGVLNGLSLGQIATQFATPFGITVTGDSTVSLPQLVYNLNDTGYSVIARIAQYARKLFYDDNNGNIMLADVGTQKHSSGFTQGVNVQSASIEFDQSDVYSDYYVMWMNFNSSADISSTSGFLAHGYSADSSVKRFKPLVIVSDQVVDSIDIGQAVAQWELNRRNGRAQAVTIVTPDWRDSAGKLWTKNMLVSINIPALKLSNVSWLIAKVVYKIDGQGGTISEITCMPASAFSVEPISLFPSKQDVIVNLQQQETTSAASNDDLNKVDLSGGNTPISPVSNNEFGGL